MRTQEGTPIDIGIDEKSRKEIADGFSRVLAETYTLYLKTHNFHWNVTGPMFQSLHKMFEEQYTALADAVDVLAERIRALGFPAPASYTQFAQLSSIKEETTVPSADQMIQQLVEGHETISRTARSVYPIADKAKDQASVELLTAQMEKHEKTAWMLRSLLQRAA